MRWVINWALGLCALVGITACSGGQTVLVEESGLQGAMPVSAAELPTSGTARYSGFLSVQLPDVNMEPGTYTGSLGLEVDFAAANGAISGRAENFRGPSGLAVAGRLFVTDGVLDRATNVQTDYSLEADLSGTLSGANLPTSALTGQLSGDFVGAGQASISGKVYGDVTTSQGVHVFDGAFAATKAD